MVSNRKDTGSTFLGRKIVLKNDPFVPPLVLKIYPLYVIGCGPYDCLPEIELACGFCGESGHKPSECPEPDKVRWKRG